MIGSDQAIREPRRPRRWTRLRRAAMADRMPPATSSTADNCDLLVGLEGYHVIGVARGRDALMVNERGVTTRGWSGVRTAGCVQARSSASAGRSLSITMPGMRPRLSVVPHNLPVTRLTHSPSRRPVPDPSHHDESLRGSPGARPCRRAMRAESRIGIMSFSPVRTCRGTANPARPRVQRAEAAGLDVRARLCPLRSVTCMKPRGRPLLR